VKTKLENMINATSYDNKTLLQLLRMNKAFVKVLAEGESFQEIKDMIDNELDIVYTDSQLDYIKSWCIRKIEC
jgi:hypothetical protein